MPARVLLATAALLAATALTHAQPQPRPAPPGDRIPPPSDLIAPPKPWVPTAPQEKSVDDLLTELEQLRAQKAALEKKEQELTATLRKKLDAQSERLQKLGIAKDANLDNKTNTPPSSFGARFPLDFAKSSPKKDKDEVVLALLIQLAPGSPAQFANTHSELAKKLAQALTELAKNNRNGRKFRVLTQTQIDEFKAANPNWKQMKPGEIGQKLGTDFVLEISLDKLRLYQPETQNAIYEGRAEVQEIVHEVGHKGDLPYTQYKYTFEYPRTAVRSADAIPESTFKAQFIEQLAKDIARQHTDQPIEPDRVGRILIEGNVKTPNQKILDKLELRPGQILQYPKLEDARMRLAKAGFRDVTIEVVPNESDSTHKDIRVQVNESKR